ncbi:Gag protein [Phytophthora palmivora]|uniref:Gag protein n=1 Tax=Phytophthora palmivora TaxID=4796 RepID=A0A2P4Y762_9STRA|nr:Gag protein [Phytophthora palmivora]
MEEAAFANLASGQQEALKMLMSLLGPESAAHLALQGPDAINARLEVFSSFDNALRKHIQQMMNTTGPYMTAGPLQGSTRPKPLMLSFQSFDGKEGENLMLWIREVQMAMSSALLQTEHQRDKLKRQILRVFLPPNHTYRVRSRFLACRQGKKELPDYVQELRTLISGMLADPIPEEVTTVLMDGLRTGVARTEAFRSRPSSFEESVAVALSAEYNFKTASKGWSVPLTSSPEGPLPMDLRYAKDKAAELLATEQHLDI